MYVLPQQTAGPRWVAGTVSDADDSSCIITLSDGRTFRRHFDHVRLRRPSITGEPVQLPPVSREELLPAKSASPVPSGSPASGVPPVSRSTAPRPWPVESPTRNQTQSGSRQRTAPPQQREDFSNVPTRQLESAELPRQRDEMAPGLAVEPVLRRSTRERTQTDFFGERVNEMC